MTLGVLSISRADVELDFDFTGQVMHGSVKLLATIDTDSISNKFCLHCRHITVLSVTINAASCNWFQRDLMTDVMMAQDGNYRDTISYTARLREAVNRSVVGELEIFLPPEGIARGGSAEIVITYSRPITATYGLGQAIGNDGRSSMLFTNGGTDMARCWVSLTPPSSPMRPPLVPPPYPPPLHQVPCVDALWLHHEWNISISLPQGYTAICGCDSVEVRSDESGGSTWDFLIRKACAGGVGWAVGSFALAHTQEALRVYTSPHLVALAPSVCVGVSRALSVSRSFLLDLVHLSEKAPPPPTSPPLPPVPHHVHHLNPPPLPSRRPMCARSALVVSTVQLHTHMASYVYHAWAGLQLLLLPEPLAGQFPWGPWLSFYGIVILGSECAHDGRRCRFCSANSTCLIFHL